MSAASNLLNADMATLGRMAREALHWWLDELRALAPKSRAAQRSATYLLYRAPGVFDLVERGQLKPDAPLPRGPVDFAFPAEFGLERRIDAPAMGRADLRRWVAAEADRLLPLPAAELLVDAEPLDRPADAALAPLRIGSLRRELVTAALADAEVAPRRIGLVDPERPASFRYDFARALIEEGALPPRRDPRAGWWIAVGLLCLLNIAVLDWRDQQSVDQLEEIVAAQNAGVRVNRTIAARIARIDAVARTTLAARLRKDPLGDLAAASEHVPDSAWVQRYEWDGASLRLAGYSKPVTDVAAALRRYPRFRDAHAATSDVQGEILSGAPFSVEAALPQGRVR